MTEKQPPPIIVSAHQFRACQLMLATFESWPDEARALLRSAGDDANRYLIDLTARIISQTGD